MSEPAEVQTDHNATPRPRLRRLVLGVLLAWAALALGLIGLAGLAIRGAQHHLAGAKNELSIDNLKAKDTPDARALADDLGRAHSMLSSPVVAPFRLLPILGRQLRAVDAIAHAGNVVAEIGIEARTQARPIVSAPPADGAARLRAIATIRDIAQTGTGRIEKLGFGPSNNLFSPIANTRARFADELDRVGEFLQRADTGAAGLDKFFKGPSRYAVFAANNSEMRAGSGMLLAGGMLDVANGELKLGPMRNIGDLPPAPNNVALEYDFLRLWGPQAPGSDYRFVNMTPRFPTTGALLQRMWAASGAPPVDGVLVLDPQAVVELMKVTGSVAVEGQEVTAATAAALLLHDQYVKITGPQDEKRRADFLGEVVRQVFDKLNGSGINPTSVGTAFAHAATGRHILAWTSGTEEQRAWSALRIDGVLPDQSVLFALQNRGGNKLDYFQHITATAKATVSGAGSVIDMDVTITNAVPPGEPTYIAGPVSGTIAQHAGDYVGIASIDLPANATNVSLTGGDFDLVSGPDGNMQVVSQWVEISPGEQLHLRLSFALPPGSRTLTIEPSARVPGIAWSIGGQNWTDDSARSVGW